MKHIGTLVPDIYSLFDADVEFKEEDVQTLGHNLARVIRTRFVEKRKGATLRMSNLGQPCRKKLWYEINAPEKAEPLPKEARFKYLFGDILEVLLLFLARVAGHTVEGEQDELVLADVVGHRDAVVDGVLVDVKSASTYGFRKFEDGTLAEDDAFGYIDQLNAYLDASQDDPLVKEKEYAAFLAVDKTLGKITMLPIPRNKRDYPKLVQEIRQILGERVPPARAYQDVPDGKSGNRKLGVACSYCPFKQICWPNLKVYAYSTGPRFLTHVAREPRVEEHQEEKF